MYEMHESDIEKKIRTSVTISFFHVILQIFYYRTKLPLNSFNSIRENGEKACLFDN